MKKKTKSHIYIVLKGNDMKILKRLAFLITALIVICIISIAVYQNMNKKALCGFYYDEESNGFVEINEDGTFKYRVKRDVSSAIYGKYRIEDDNLILESEHNGEYIFQIGYEKLKFIKGDDMTDRLVEKNENYSWNPEMKYSIELKPDKQKIFINSVFIILILISVVVVCITVYKRKKRIHL